MTSKSNLSCRINFGESLIWLYLITLRNRNKTVAIRNKLQDDINAKIFFSYADRALVSEKQQEIAKKKQYATFAKKDLTQCLSK
jgi:hypothetical protein